MAEVTNAKAAVFNLFNIGSALLNAMTLCQLIKAIDDFNGKFGISGVSDFFSCTVVSINTLDLGLVYHARQHSF
ncbi:hypothetical protein BSPWISOXPB_6775 [uncultured Gammaproteobacteria bacterium]|nr:hypothetical protein BSPWISOXPB_6775 [uncultured Gammaproteobacteria bacterium]